MKNIHCPVLVIWEEKDKANKTTCTQLTKQTPHTKSIIISGAGHDVNIGSPIKLGNESNRFFNAIS